MKPAFDMEVQPLEHFIIRCGDKKYVVLVTSEGRLVVTEEER